MKIEEILTILQNRLLSLNEARKVAINTGDMERLVQIEGDILTTYLSIDQIKKPISNTQ